jgi:hypothetical protein
MKYRILLIIVIFGIVASVHLFAQPKLSMRVQNLGHMINSSDEEFLPVIYKDTLYFRRSIGKSKQIRIYSIACKDITTPAVKSPLQINLFNSNNLAEDEDKLSDEESKRATTPAFNKFTTDKLAFMGDPIAIADVNSDFNDFQPSLSSDGNILIFASDRSGDHTQTDIWISTRKPDGTWTSPVNDLGKGINTNFNDIAPYIAPDGTLYYSSKGFIRDSVEMFFSAIDKKQDRTKNDVLLRSERRNYNIVAAEPIPGQKTKWKNPKLLPYPINTEWNEVGTAIWHDTLIYYASDRPSDSRRGWGDSYGKYDLYGTPLEKCPDCFDTCKPAQLIVKILNECGDYFRNNGHIILRDSLGNDLSEKIVPNDGILKIALPTTNRSFIVELSHPCLKAKQYRSFSVECQKPRIISAEDCKPLTNNDIITKTIDFYIPGNCAKVLDSCDCAPNSKGTGVVINKIQTVYEELPMPDIPFFVTGYYKPNTLSNLYDLRNKIDSKELGKKANNGTEYIANPDDDNDEAGNLIDYDDISFEVESALSNSAETISKMLDRAKKSGNKLEVIITGYADKRKLNGNPPIYRDSPVNLGDYLLTASTAKSKYNSDNIMDNDKLSILRAYFTKQYIESLLQRNYDKSAMIWKLSGKGSVSEENTMLRNRKVEIRAKITD